MIEHELVIGKYTLESLTNGMYASPLDLYREYIQNAVDSIDSAQYIKLERAKDLRIDININEESRVISIRDNGCGISSANAVSTLIDIGNSTKSRSLYRGFRGIGRLAGLGYCSELVFTTSMAGENVKSIIAFNAELLHDLLLTNEQESVSVSDVMGQVINISVLPEKDQKHYFEVKLIGVHDSDGLLDELLVKDYLLQHAPLPYSIDFKWRRTVHEKVRLAGYVIPSYNISLNGDALFKPYRDNFVSDRVKKVEDYIQDIIVKPFYRDNVLIAILWYAKSSFFGTINDNTIKGIRIRQGNILIGDKTTCNSLFKEERFNGWLIGELHVIDPDLIVNSRRDNFEKNQSYHCLVNAFKEWTNVISKDIRRISYERSLTRERKAIVEAQYFEDVNDLCTEDLSFAEDTAEIDFLDSGESQTIAESDYIGKLSVLLGQKKAQTKYRALNINSKLTMEQRKVLERVFDVIQQEFSRDQAELFINCIAKNF